MKKYSCDCGWIGEEWDMESDHNWDGIDGDEIWSDYICPSCGDWHMNDLTTYKLIKEE